jgi:hypothetical protein
MGDFLRFETMLTPVLIQVLFWIAVVLVVIGGLIMLFSSPVKGLLLIILGPIAARVYAEIIIIFFRINDHLRAIQHNTQPR